MLTNECTLISCPEILTMDEGKPTAEAVCISEGKILAVGTLEELRALAGEERLAGFGHVLLRSGCKCIWSVIHRMLLHALLEENRNFKYLKSNREPRSSGANTAPCGKSGNARRNRQRNQPISAAGYFATAASICSSVDVATPWMRNGFRYVACV